MNKTPERISTQCIHVDPAAPLPELMALAGQIIRERGLVAFPTETVYGLGADALDAGAVARIFAAKGRPANDPVIVHIADMAQLDSVARDIPELARRLAAQFWPGPLTLVLPRHANVPHIVTSGQETVAVRMPAHPVALALIAAAGRPVAAPSANRFSRPSPTEAGHVLADLEGRVDVVLDGGPTPIGVESTILDLSGPLPVVLRPGGVPLEALQAHIPALAFRPRYLPEDIAAAPAPGTLLRHYSPEAEVRLYDGPREAVLAAMRADAARITAAGGRAGALLADDDAPALQGTSLRLALLGQDAAAQASALFAGLRELDAQGLEVILVRMPDAAGLGLALRDRLLRAAEGRVIAVGGGTPPR